MQSRIRNEKNEDGDCYRGDHEQTFEDVPQPLGDPSRSFCLQSGPQARVQTDAGVNIPHYHNRTVQRSSRRVCADLIMRPPA